MTIIGKVEFPDPEVDEDYIAVFMHTGACDEYTHVWSDTYTHEQMYTHVWTDTYTHTQMHKYIFAYAHAQLHAYTCSHTYAHAYKCTHARTNTGMHVKIQKQPTAT